jgi:hypothetical protein
MIIKKTYVVLIGLVISTLMSFGQSTPIEACDDFFNSLSIESPTISNLFTRGAHITSLVYDSAGLPQNKSFTPAEFQTQIQSLSNDFNIDQKPVVLIFRQYQSLASIYCSVWITLTDKETGKTLKSRSIQSLKFVRDSGAWKINHIVIQNEHPNYPIDDEMFPIKLTQPLESRMTQDLSVMPDFSTEYDTNKVYRMEEVDEPPVYPGTDNSLSDLLQSFDVTTQPSPGYTPFIITIDEDGSAYLSYAHDLSGFQISRAESLVRSMLIWYPAIKYAASVKCKLILYIHD